LATIAVQPERKGDDPDCAGAPEKRYRFSSLEPTEIGALDAT
jgi:hypothetical protein